MLTPNEEYLVDTLTVVIQELRFTRTRLDKQEEITRLLVEGQCRGTNNIEALSEILLKHIETTNEISTALTDGQLKIINELKEEK